MNTYKDMRKENCAIKQVRTLKSLGKTISGSNTKAMRIKKYYEHKSQTYN